MNKSEIWHFYNRTKTHQKLINLSWAWCGISTDHVSNQFNSKLIVCLLLFLLKENGLLFVPKGQVQNPQAQMFSDPNMAMDMMKKNLSMIIPQVLNFLSFAVLWPKILGHTSYLIVWCLPAMKRWLWVWLFVMLFLLVEQTLTFAWVNFFFSGFVAGKFSQLLSLRFSS